MIKLLSCLIPNKFLRDNFRLVCNSIQVRFTAKSIGKNLYCGKYSTVNKNTVIQNDVRLNGLRTSGKGSVVIGNNVVIGFDALIISDTHNYKGDRCKSNHFTRGKNWRRCNYSGRGSCSW